MFNYFTDSIVIILIGYASIYPFYFWIVPLQKIDQGFYRFNLGKCCIVGSLGAIAYHFIALDLFSEIILIAWLILLGTVTAYYWNRNQIHNIIITIVSSFGCFALLNIIRYLVQPDIYLQASISVIIGSMITTGVFFAMILGHWYLNVIALPISLLKKSTMSLWIILIIRIFWDVYYISFNQYIDPYGISKNIWSFIFEFDGLLILVALFMGNIFPIVINYFVWRTLKLQATQSATGLLYVSIISILFGDIIFKYYLLQYGFPL